MHDQIVPKLHKWPFLAGDALMLGFAYFVYRQSAQPLGTAEMLTCAFCVAAGAVLAVLPFVSEYRAAVQLAETKSLTATVGQIRKLEQVAAQISSATSLWQSVQDSAGKTAGTAKEIAAGMAAEIKNFNEFLQRANDSERAALRLEVEKARRAEGEWLQVIVRMLDHVFALHQAALRSGQPSLIEQLGTFQNACRDAARRVGLMPFTAARNEAFDEQRHQVMNGTEKDVEDATVDETIANGYTFQGRLLRPALVRLQSAIPAANGETKPAAAEASPAGAQSHLPLA